MSQQVIKADMLEAERSLQAIRRELEKLHRLTPQNLPKTKFASIVALLPTSQDILAPPQQATAATHAFTTLRWIRWLLISSIFKIYWIIVYLLASIGGFTVFIFFIIYLLSKLNWQTTYTGQGQGWHQHSDGYYYWGKPEDQYASTVTASVKTDFPEIEAREL